MKGIHYAKHPSARNKPWKVQLKFNGNSYRSSHATEAEAIAMVKQLESTHHRSESPWRRPKPQEDITQGEKK